MSAKQHNLDKSHTVARRNSSGLTETFTTYHCALHFPFT